MITVLTQPPKFSPANAAIYKVSSDRPNILQFRVVVKDADTDLTMSTQKYSNLPMFPSGTTFDLAPVLKSFIDDDLKPKGAILAEVPRVLKKYRVLITELYRDADSEIVEGDSYTIPTDLYVFNATIDGVTFNYYTADKYIAGNPAHTSLASFLNYKPLVNKTYHDSINYLYFITAVASRVAVRIYKRPGTLLNTVYITGATDNKAYRVMVSPDDLIAQFGADVFATGDSEFDEEFTEEFGSPDRLSSLIYYTVTVEDLSGNALTETRTFAYIEKPCGKVLNIIWSNGIGGFDSMNFENYKQSVSSVRTTIAANPYQLDNSGNLLLTSNNVFNPDKVTIASDSDSTFSMVSGILSDELSYYLAGLIESENVLVQLPNGDLYPVQITETNYDIARRKLTTNNNRMSVSFTISDSKIKL